MGFWPESHDHFRRKLQYERLERRDAPGILLAGLPDAWFTEMFPGRTAGDERSDFHQTEQTPKTSRTTFLEVEIRQSVAADVDQAWAQWSVTQLSESKVANSGAIVNRAANIPTWMQNPLPVAPGNSLVSDVWSDGSVGSSGAHVRTTDLLFTNPPPSYTLPALAGGGVSARPAGGGSGGGGSSIESNGVANQPQPNGIAHSNPAVQPISGGAQINTGNQASEYGLLLTDSSGVPLTLTLDANTIVIGAATWCSACANFKQIASDPIAQAEIEGLRLVFAFGDEGGNGPGGVQNASFLSDLPGEVAFLASGSVRPSSFPSAFNTATGSFDQHPMDSIQAWWLSKQGLAAPAPNSTASGLLSLVDARGEALNVTSNANTLVIGAATWCGATAKFKEALARPEVAEQFSGLRIIFAFDDEGGNGPGGVQNGDFLTDMPGEVAFLAPGSVRPERLPMAYNPSTAQFDLTAVEALNAWAGQSLMSGGTCGNKNATATPPQASTEQQITEIPPGGAGGSVIDGDYSGNNVVDAADYVVWRKLNGSAGVGLAADGNNDDEVDELDYGVWTTNFGSLIELPGEFSITGPGHALSVDDFTITWTASMGADSYQLSLSNNSDCSAPFYTETVVGTSKSFENYGDSSFYTCVSASNEAGTVEATNDGYQVSIVTTQLEVIFVTATNYFIDHDVNYPPFGGLFHDASAADYHCTNLADINGLLDEPWNGTDIIFQALLTEDFTNLTTRAGATSGAYVNVNGDVVANSRNDLYAGNFLNSILTPAGNVVAGTNVPVWTGATAAGEWSGFTCENWTNPVAAGGTVGNVKGTGSSWLSNGTRACHLGARLYCIGTP